MNMKQFLAIVAIALLAQLTPASQASAYQTPKQEFRASRVATVYEIDWPVNSQRTVQVQKGQLRIMLDSLQRNNVNAVCIQVR